MLHKDTNEISCSAIICGDLCPRQSYAISARASPQFCYHCHQAAEKSLKGFFVFHKTKFHKIHDLIALLNICLTQDKTLEFLREDLETLNQYYIETKYPPDMPIDYPKEEAREAIDKAKIILDSIKDKLE